MEGAHNRERVDVSNPINEEFVNYLINGLPVGDRAKHMLLFPPDPIPDGNANPIRTAQKTLNLLLGHQQDGTIDKASFYCICVTLTGYLYFEREIQKGMPQTAIFSRRLALMLKAASAITDQKMRDLVTFDADKKEPAPYNGVFIAEQAIARDRDEKAVTNGIPMEYMAAVMDGQGTLPQKRSRGGCYVIIVIGIMIAIWMIL